MYTTYLRSLVLLTAAATLAGAQATARVPVAPSSKLWIEGTSNLHAWSCAATTIDAAIDVDATAVQLAAAPPKMLKRVAVKVPVKSLKCGHGAMDSNLYKALKADESPDISYIMATFEAAAGESNELTLHTVGTLLVAGKENSIKMDVAAVRLADGTLQATGTVPIKMSDFGIKPPTAIFGRLKTGDEVMVKFDLTIGPKAIAAAVESK